MSEKKYLDDTQTARLWAKIKALIPDISGKLDKSGGTMTGKLILDGDPTSDYHAATKKYVDENAGGGSVDSVNGQTGVVVLDASDVGAQASITASGMLKADGNGNVSEAVAGTDYIASHQDISGKLDKSGGTMTGALTLSGAPTENLHASTKKYVDDSIAGIDDNAFVAEYGTTSYEDLVDARIDEKTLFAVKDHRVYVFDTFDNILRRFYFRSPGPDLSTYYVICRDDSDHINPYAFEWSHGTDAPMPSQTGNSGKFLTTNGSAMSWGTVNALPSQTGNSGKYLTTNGTSASWASISIPSKVSDLTNDSGFLTLSTLPIYTGGVS